MKKLSIFIILLMCLLPMNAQQVTIKDVANATYRAEGIRGIRPMLDGEHYTQISSDGKRLVKYSLKREKKSQLFLMWKQPATAPSSTLMTISCRPMKA